MAILNVNIKCLKIPWHQRFGQYKNDVIDFSEQIPRKENMMKAQYDILHDGK